MKMSYVMKIRDKLINKVGKWSIFYSLHYPPLQIMISHKLAKP
jgi:hypothetical protein